MLILTRSPRPGLDSIILRTPGGTEIRVQLLMRDNNRLALGIEAPREVLILREELTRQPEEPPCPTK